MDKNINIINDIAINEKMKLNTQYHKDLYWVKKVDIVAQIAKDMGLMEYDMIYWSEQPALVNTMIYNLYKEEINE